MGEDGANRLSGRESVMEEELQVVYQEGTMSFGLYLTGFIVLVIGLALGAHLMHVPPRWIGVGVIVLMGLGILSAVSTTRHRDPSD
jgi:peptidoglycan/LPS O-acetylase OafA/YrhL